MSVDLRLKRIIMEQLTLCQEKGVGVLLDAEAEDRAIAREWVQLDEFVLGFMRHEMPKHPTLYEAVMGGTLFKDSLSRDEAPRFFTPDDVKRLATALEQIRDPELRARFEATKDIFGGAGFGGSNEQAFNHLREWVWKVAQYFHEAAQNEEAMLLLLH